MSALTSTQRLILSLGVVLATPSIARGQPTPAKAPAPWTASEIQVLQSLWIGHADSLPPDPSNKYADDPRAFELGRSLFEETKLSGNGALSCAHCHMPGRSFQDDLPLGQGVGTTGRRTMQVAGTAFSQWFFWDGRADSQWAQALGPLESAVEHAGTRTLYARVIAANYNAQYQAIFGAFPPAFSQYPLPQTAGPLGTPAEREAWNAIPADAQDAITRIFVNAGKAIAAYERRVRYAPSRFDRYVEQFVGARPRPASVASQRTPDEMQGLRLFIGKGKCVSCHSGAMLTDNRFHNIGIGGTIDGAPDSGRVSGLRQATASEFNCRGVYSDAPADACPGPARDAAGANERVQAFRTPWLRNVGRRGPYGHTGQFATLDAMVDWHNRAPAAALGHSELSPLGLSADELRLITTFLRTLDSRTLIVPPVPAQAAAESRRNER